MPTTLPDLPAARKRASRVWLYGPYLAVLLVAIGWSGAWVFVRGQVARQLDAAAASPTGPRLGWSRRSIAGYPFRIEVVLDDFHAREPSGWGIAAGQVRAETYAYDLKHWVAYAPKGLTLSRPRGGDVAVTGEALRASLASETPGQARVSIEGVKLIFTPAPGAQPFPVLTIAHFDAHTRPAPGPDRTEFLIQMKDATLPATGVLGRLAAGGPMSSAWLGVLSKSTALRGRDWPDAARAWSAAGGVIDIAQGDIGAGPLKLQASGGRLAIDSNGRLAGAVSLTSDGLREALAVVGKAADPAPKAELTFHDGQATLGAVAIGPAPRVY